MLLETFFTFKGQLARYKNKSGAINCVLPMPMHERAGRGFPWDFLTAIRPKFDLHTAYPLHKLKCTCPEKITKKEKRVFFFIVMRNRRCELL